jgi:hypothetical protein
MSDAPPPMKIASHAAFWYYSKSNHEKQAFFSVFKEKQEIFLKKKRNRPSSDSVRPCHRRLLAVLLQSPAAGGALFRAQRSKVSSENREFMVYSISIHRDSYSLSIGMRR